MTPDAVDALNAVAAAVEAHTTQGATLNEALLADQRAARRRERERFQVVNRVLAGIAMGMVVALVLLVVVVVQSRADSIERDERTQAAVARQQLGTERERCANSVIADMLGRLSTLAVQPRFRENPDGSPVLDAEGRPIPLSSAELLAQNESLRRDVHASNERLTRVSDICYLPVRPDPTPLDGDPTK